MPPRNQAACLRSMNKRTTDFLDVNSHNQIATHPELILDSRPVQQGQIKFAKDTRINAMTIHPSSTHSSNPPHPDKPETERVPPRIATVQIAGSSSTQDLTPLQRQRLDTAVMLLVNHLISASSQS